MFVWTIGDALSLIAVAVVLVLGGFIAAAESWRQSRCKHDGGVTETGACDAICRKCLKNLGFIGSWREKQNSKWWTVIRTEVCGERMLQVQARSATVCTWHRAKSNTSG